MKQTEMNVMVLLNSIDKVKRFVSIVEKIDADCDMIRGRYTIDAKSIMGLFSLDLSKPLQLRIHADASDVPEEIRADLIEFMVEKQDRSAI